MRTERASIEPIVDQIVIDSGLPRSLIGRIATKVAYTHIHNSQNQIGDAELHALVETRTRISTQFIEVQERKRAQGLPYRDYRDSTFYNNK